MTDTATREQAATEKRNWVRTIRACNNRCTFCLDADMLDGFVVPAAEVRQRIREGRDEGAARLILSGGEASIHPHFLEFVAYGRECGYNWIQTISNGRRFAYGKFTARAKALGLNEITFSIHGHTPELHDALSGVKGAFEQALRGLVNARRLGMVANVDVVLNRQNLPHLKEILDFFMGLGVHEFDLLWLVPFGRGFTPEHRENLFITPGEAFPHIQRALAGRARPGLYLWTNRFPVEYLEGYEWLIQEPYKILDEVNGRREMFTDLAARGDQALGCLGERCEYCFMQRFCEVIRRFRRRLSGAAEPGLGENKDGFAVAALDGPLSAPRAERFQALVAAHPVRRLEVQARTIDEAGALVAPLVGPLPEIVLRLDDYAGIGEGHAALGVGEITRLTLWREGQMADIAAELARHAELEVELWVNQETLPILKALLDPSPPLPLERVVVVLANRSRLTAVERDEVSPEAVRAVLAELPPGSLRVRNLPPCLAGGQTQDDPEFPAAGVDRLRPELVCEEPRRDGVALLDPFAFAAQFILDHYYARSLRCERCDCRAVCRGLHINALRAFGFGVLSPERAAGACDGQVAR